MGCEGGSGFYYSDSKRWIKGNGKKWHRNANHTAVCTIDSTSPHWEEIFPTKCGLILKGDKGTGYHAGGERCRTCVNLDKP